MNEVDSDHIEWLRIRGRAVLEAFHADISKRCKALTDESRDPNMTAEARIRATDQAAALRDVSKFFESLHRSALPGAPIHESFLSTVR
jgi:hypothetical protein